ncbi:MAG: VCBS repeat-containing protein [Planctomycetes bacterium]|nr:VCBS repeat-containing protein [Planctomycetota bacterium]
MRKLACISLLFAIALAGCGNSVPSANNSNRSAANSNSGPAANSGVPEIRALMPPDLDGDGVPESIPHPSLQRLLVQAPQGTGFRLTSGGIDAPFSVTMVSLGDATAYELTLSDPIGTRTLTLRAGPYTLSLRGDPALGVQQPLTARPTTAGALANDLANPTGALYASVDDVAFCLTGGLPPLSDGGLVLRSGKGRAIELQLSVTAEGLRAKPGEALEPRRLYALEATGKAKDSYGRPVVPDFHLFCRGKPDKTAIALKMADLNRDGEPELICLFKDGSITALTDPAGRAEGVLPPGDEAAIDFATGDFDGNGAADLLVLLQGKKTFRVLTLYNLTRLGESRFAMQSDELPLEAPIAMRAADFDRDGRDDYAVLGAFGDVLVQYSNRAAQLFSGLETRSLAAGLIADDANADGKPDLYIMGADGNGRLLLNINGSGFGTELGVLPLGVAGAQRVTTGELDGDKHSDFMFTGRSSDITVVLGAQMKPSKFHLNGENERLAGTVLCKDVNRDSRMDLLVAREDDRGVADEVGIYLNSENSDGNPDAILPMGARVRIEAMEYWRDHIVFATNAGLLVLKVNPADMPPTVDSKVRFIEAYEPVPQIPAPLAAAIADFNDDGRTDLAALDRNGNLQIWLSGAEGEPFAPAGDAILLGANGSLQAIDFDRDSAPDLLYIPNDPNLSPRVLRNNRAGRFDDEDQGLLPTPPSILRGAPALGDFDRDGDLDVLWPSPLGRVQFNEGRDGWRESRNMLEIREESGLRLQFSGELACADFTGDGIEDVAAVMQVSEDGAGAQYIVLLEGTGSSDDTIGPFRATISTAIKGRIFGLSPADFNGDGKLDLAVGYGDTDATVKLTLLQLAATRQFEAFEGSPTSKGRLLDLALDDLDRDGDLDLIASEDTPDGRNTMTLWVNDGKGRFGEATDAQKSLADAIGEFRATNLSLADFTGDGRPDLLAIDRDGHVVIVRTTLP